MKYFGRIINAKEKHPTQASFIYFPFVSGRDRVDGCTEMLD